MKPTQFSVIQDDMHQKIIGVVSSDGLDALLELVSLWTQVPRETVVEMFSICKSIDCLLLTIYLYMEEKEANVEESHRFKCYFTEEAKKDIVARAKQYVDYVTAVIDQRAQDMTDKVLLQMGGIEV